MYKAIICSLEHQVQELTNSTSLLQNKIDELGALNSLLQYQVEQLTGEMRVLKLRNENLVGRDLSNLNTSQLEELETIHHDGLRCISTEKLRRLESEMEAQKNKFQEMQEQFLCLVCCDQQSVVVLLPCAHQCLCDGCAAKLDLCPVCRATIEQRITTYRS
jgi:FtsZ-binding cell division protein ZapB